MMPLDDRRRERNSTTPLMMWALSLAVIAFSLLGYCYFAMGNGSIFM
jgi:hypothetical protein